MRLFIWGGHDRIDLIRAVAEAGDSTITGVGDPSPKGSAELAEAFEVDREDELRSIMHRDDFDLLWLAGAEPLDPDTRRALWTSGCPVVSTEPRPGAFGEVIESRAACPLATGPLFRTAPGMATATDVIDTFGDVQTIQVSMRCTVGQGTLFARLFDAVDTACLLLGECQSVAAVLSGPFREVPEHPRALRGWLSVVLQFDGGRAASLLIGDLAPGWFRGVSVMTDTGLVRVTDDRCQTVPEASPTAPEDESGTESDPARLFATEMCRVAEGRPSPGPPIDHSRLLAVCETIRLSCRTGHVESTHTMLEMLAGS